MSYAPSIDPGLPLQVRSFPPLSSFNAPPPPAVVDRTLLSSAHPPSIDADAVVAVVSYLSITTYQHAPPSSSSDPPSPCRRRHRPSRNHHPDPPPGLLPLRSMPGGKYRGGHVWLDAQEVRRIGHEISVRRRSQRGRQGQDTVVLGCRRRRRRPLPPSPPQSSRSITPMPLAFDSSAAAPRGVPFSSHAPPVAGTTATTATRDSWTRPRSSSSFSRIASPSSTIADRKAVTTSGLARIRCVPPECLCRMSIVVGSPSSSHLSPSCQGIMFAQ